MVINENNSSSGYSYIDRLIENDDFYGLKKELDGARDDINDCEKRLSMINEKTSDYRRMKLELSITDNQKKIDYILKNTQNT